MWPHKGNTVDNDVGEEAGVGLSVTAKAGVAAQLALQVVLALPMPCQPYLSQPRHPSLAHLLVRPPSP